jgi:transcriptional regulator with XRE-family HTH domain
MSKPIYALVHERYGDWRRFIRRLVGRMAEHDITQQQLAKRSGYHASHVSSWLREKIEPQLKTMMFLDEAMDQLIDDKEATC